MKTEKEKQLEIQLLTEKIERISGKKVILRENINQQKIDFDFQEDRIFMNGITKEELENNIDFLSNGKKIIPLTKPSEKYNWILWIDWMSYKQFDTVAKFLNIKY